MLPKSHLQVDEISHMLGMEVQCILFQVVLLHKLHDTKFFLLKKLIFCLWCNTSVTRTVFNLCGKETKLLKNRIHVSKVISNHEAMNHNWKQWKNCFDGVNRCTHSQNDVTQVYCLFHMAIRYSTNILVILKMLIFFLLLTLKKIFQNTIFPRI